MSADVNIELKPSRGFPRRSVVRCNRHRDVTAALYAPSGPVVRSLAWLESPLDACRIMRPRADIPNDTWTFWLGRSALDVTEPEAKAIAAELGLPIPDEPKP